jgi:cation transport ATPase
MLTGDNKAAAESIAEKVGIENVIPDVLPADKAKLLKTCSPKAG